MFKSFNPHKKGLSIIKSDPGSLVSYVLREREVGQLPDNNFPVIKRGKGPYLYDYDENRYVDFYLSEGSLLFGHSPPGLTKIVKSWLGRGHASGYLVSSLRLLSNKTSGLIVNGTRQKRLPEGKWLFCDSSAEALLKIAPLLGLLGYGGAGVYITDSPPAADAPWNNVVDINDKESIAKADLPRLDYVVLQFKKEISEDRIKEIFTAAGKNNPVLISDETAFSSYMLADNNEEFRNRLSMRVFGSWVSAGISTGFVYIDDGIINKNFRNMSFGETCEIFHRGSTPLYKIKAAVECLKNVEKSGSYSKLIDRARYFYKLLDHDIFTLKNGFIFIKENKNLLKEFEKIRSRLMERGLYFPLSPLSPLFLSFSHSEELLAKCAGQINSVFSEFYR